jgi:quinol-cytochrome oxidoreductase complex cytochrome b subunit
MTQPSIEVILAEIGKDIKHIIRRLDEGNNRFDQLEKELAEHDKLINRLFGGIALAMFIVPIIVAIVVRML